jgi:erythromycin esterase
MVCGKQMVNLALIVLFVCSTSSLYLKAQIQNQPIREGMLLEKELLRDERHAYTFMLNKGEGLEMTVLQKGVDIVIDIYDEENIKVKSFDGPNGNSGPEDVFYQAPKSSKYRLVIYPFVSPQQNPTSAKENQGSYVITRVHFISLKEFEDKSRTERRARANVVEWILENKVPLNTLEAGKGYEDLRPLKEILSNVKYVGLGETTHGTHEFFKIKHRLIEFLVKELGFTVFTIEASYTGCENINDYILYGRGNAKGAIASQGFWYWDTEEFLSIIEWLRSYNQTVSEEKKVRFLGFDVQKNNTSGTFDRLYGFLQKADPKLAVEKNSLFNSLRDLEKNRNSYPDPESYRREFFNLLAFMRMRSGHYINLTSQADYEQAMRWATIIAQYVDFNFMSASDPRRIERDWRDFYMADNFYTFVQQFPPGTKMILWAHNSHISKNERARVNRGVRPFGSYIKAAYGDAYYAMGFSFGKGGFRANKIDEKGNGTGVQPLTVGPANENTLDALLGAAGEQFIINFRNDNLPESVQAFVAKPLKSRNIGDNYSPDNPDNYFPMTTIAKDFDALIFISNTSASIPIQR